MSKKIRIAISLIVLAVSILFLGYLISLNILPSKYIILACICVSGIPAILSFAGFITKKRRNHIVGIVFSITWLLLIGFVSLQLDHTMRVVEKVSGKTVETHSVAICVRKNDSASSVEDLKNYTFGAIEFLDKENTDHAIRELEGKSSASLKLLFYPDATTLVLSMLAQKVDAIILNEAYFSLVEEEEKYESILDYIRVVKRYEFTEEIVIKKPEKKREEKQEKVTMDNFVMYISGIDTTGKLSKTSRSDVNILAVVNTNTKKILLVNTPRDYYVPLSISHGVRDKLTHAGIYGVEVSRDTLGMLYGVTADYYFRVNFSGFKKIIDALGGVNVYSDYEFTSLHEKYHYDKGYNALNGSQALEFARERYSYSAGDRQRGKNQMAVITAIVEKAQTSSMLKNYSNLLEGISDSFETNLSAKQITELVQMQLSDNAKWTVENISVDGSGSSKKTYSMSKPCYVMEPDMSTVDVAKEKIKQVLEGK